MGLVISVTLGNKEIFPLGTYSISSFINFTNRSPLEFAEGNRTEVSNRFGFADIFGAHENIYAILIC